MQTQTLPIELSGAGANPAPQRAKANPSNDNAQFSQALSREMEQRQPVAAKPQAAPAPQQKTAQAPPAPQQKTAQAPVKAADGKPAPAIADTAVDEAQDDAADAAATSPVADMLALVASFNQPAAAATDPLAVAAAAAAAQAMSGAALKGSDPAGYADQQLKGVTDVLTPASKALAFASVPPAAADRGLSFKDVAQAIDGAARFSMTAKEATAKDATSSDADMALPLMPGAGNAPRADKGGANLGALAAGTAQTSGAEGADTGIGQARAEPGMALPAVKADAAPLRAREGAADIAAIKEPAASAPVAAPMLASVAMAQAVNGAPLDRIAARVGTPGWDSQVGQKIVWMVAGKEQSATLTLNPPDMGPMQVVLSVTNDQATVTFTAAQPEVRQALENAMPKLREMMGESGIALGNASVNAGSPEQRQAQQGEQSRGQGAGNRFGRGVDIAGTAEAPRAARSGGSGLVDTFA